MVGLLGLPMEGNLALIAPHVLNFLCSSSAWPWNDSGVLCWFIYFFLFQLLGALPMCPPSDDSNARRGETQEEQGKFTGLR